MGTTWGYARASTEDQELGLQITALRAGGVPEANIVQEKASGKVGSDRPLYAGLLERLKDDDRLVVGKVDRLGRSTLEWLNAAKDLDERGVHLDEPTPHDHRYSQAAITVTPPAVAP
jgi:DNA invertase Pin-like site-specific DNA recombinase